MVENCAAAVKHSPQIATMMFVFMGRSDGNGRRCRVQIYPAVGVCGVALFRCFNAIEAVKKPKGNERLQRRHG